MVPPCPLISAAALHCRPRTGRSHQIRVHLQHLGHPIANDVQYGGTYRGPVPTMQLAKHMGVSWDVPQHGLTMPSPVASAALAACGAHQGASEEQQRDAFHCQEGQEGRDKASQQQGSGSTSATASQAVRQVLALSRTFITSSAYQVDADARDPLCLHCPSVACRDYPVDLQPLWLHALSYSCCGAGWIFSCPLPDWAAPGYVPPLDPLE